MYKLQTNKTIFFWHIYFTLSYILKNKNKQKTTNKQINKKQTNKKQTNKNKNKQQQQQKKNKDKFMTDTRANRPYYQCPKPNTLLFEPMQNLRFWMFSLLFCYSLFCSVLFSLVFVFCFFFICWFVCLFLILFAAVDASPTPPPPGGGADLRHGARRCEYLKTYFYDSPVVCKGPISWKRAEKLFDRTPFEKNLEIFTSTATNFSWQAPKFENFSSQDLFAEGKEGERKGTRKYKKSKREKGKGRKER